MLSVGTLPVVLKWWNSGVTREIQGQFPQMKPSPGFKSILKWRIYIEKNSFEWLINVLISMRKTSSYENVDCSNLKHTVRRTARSNQRHNSSFFIVIVLLFSRRLSTFKGNQMLWQTSGDIIILQFENGNVKKKKKMFKTCTSWNDIKATMSDRHTYKDFPA